MPNYSTRKSSATDEVSRKKRKRQVLRQASKLLLREAALTGTLTDNGEEDVLCSGAEYASVVDNARGPINDEAPQEDRRPTVSPFTDDGNADDDESFIGFEDDEEEEEDDDDFISDFVSWDDDSLQEVSRERADELSADLADGDGIPPTATYDDTDELPTVQQDVDFSELEIATLELLSLCDRSGARRGFYDELLTLLRRFRRDKIDISRAKGRNSFVGIVSKKVKAPKAKTTVIQGRKVVYFPFFHCFRDLLRSSVFDDANNLCVNEDKDDRFKPFVPTSNKDIGEVMAKRWASETLAVLRST